MAYVRSRAYRPTGPDDDTRQALAERSMGRCELALDCCEGRASEAVHRLRKGAGGRHGEARERINALSNLYHGCPACHRWQHARPTEAHDLHLMLREGDDPLSTPARYRGVLVLLRDDGTIAPVLMDMPSRPPLVADVTIPGGEL